MPSGVDNVSSGKQEVLIMNDTTSFRTLPTPLPSNPEDIFHHKHTQDIFFLLNDYRKDFLAEAFARV